MAYIKYTAYSTMIIFFVGVSVLTGLKYVSNGKGRNITHYHYVSYEPVKATPTVTFCLNDPRENIKYQTKEEVIYVRPILRPTDSPRQSYAVDVGLNLPVVKDIKVQKDAMEFYLDAPVKK